MSGNKLPPTYTRREFENDSLAEASIALGGAIMGKESRRPMRIDRAIGAGCKVEKSPRDKTIRFAYSLNFYFKSWQTRVSTHK
jgi:hypothetical protein